MLYLPLICFFSGIKKAMLTDSQTTKSKRYEMEYSGLTAVLHVCLFPVYIKYDFSDGFNICISNLSKIIPGIKVGFNNNIHIYNQIIIKIHFI